MNIKHNGVSDICRTVVYVLLVLLCLPSVTFGQQLSGIGKVVTPGGYAALSAAIGQRGNIRVIIKVDSAFQPMARGCWEVDNA